MSFQQHPDFGEMGNGLDAGSNYDQDQAFGDNMSQQMNQLNESIQGGRQQPPP